MQAYRYVDGIVTPASATIDPRFDQSPAAAFAVPAAEPVCGLEQQLPRGRADSPERDERARDHPGARVMAHSAANRQEPAPHQGARALTRRAVHHELAARHAATSLGSRAAGPRARVAPDLDGAAGHAEPDLVPDVALHDHRALGEAGTEADDLAAVAGEVDGAVGRAGELAHVAQRQLAPTSCHDRATGQLGRRERRPRSRKHRREIDGLRRCRQPGDETAHAAGPAMIFRR